MSHFLLSEREEQLNGLVEILRREKQLADEKAQVEHSETNRLRAQLELLEQTNQSLKVSLEGVLIVAIYVIQYLAFTKRTIRSNTVQYLWAYFTEQDEQIRTLMARSSEHAELVARIESQSLLREANDQLRASEARLRARVGEQETELKELRSQLEERLAQTRSLEAAQEASQSENRLLRQEVERWQSRTNSLMKQIAADSSSSDAERESQRFAFSRIALLVVLELFFCLHYDYLCFK